MAYNKSGKTDILTPYVLDNQASIETFIVGLLRNQLDRSNEKNEQDPVEKSEVQESDSNENIHNDAHEGAYTEYLETDENTYINTLQTESGKILKTLLMRILNNCRKIYAIYVPFYDDRYYRSSFSLSYYGKHFQLSRYCGRLFLFDGFRYDEIMTEVLNENGRYDDSRIFEGSFIGSIVKKPIAGMEVGRTLIDPKYLYGKDVYFSIRTACYSETLYGIRLHVYAFPYAMQDGETVTCAEMTIQNLSDYYSRRYQDYYNIFPAEISRLATGSSYERRIPSTGLTYRAISRLLMDIRFSPKLYATKYDREHFLTILHIYLSSGIPVAMGIDNRNGLETGHSIVVVGKEKEIGKRLSASGYFVEQYPNRTMDSVLYIGVLGSRKGKYILMDDGRAPYTSTEISAEYHSSEKGNLWNVTLEYSKNPYSLRRMQSEKDQPLQYDVSFLIAPLSREMAMDAVAAVQCFKNLIIRDGETIDSPGLNYYAYYTKYIRYARDLEGNYLYSDEERRILKAGDSENNPLLLRIFLCPSRSFKKHRIEYFPPDIDQNWLYEYRGIHMPRFIWVCELYSRLSIQNSNPFCIGEIIIDASSAGSHSSDISKVIMVNYPGRLLTRDPEDDEFQFRRKMLNDDQKKQQKGKQKDKEETDFLWPFIKPFTFRDKRESQS